MKQFKKLSAFALACALATTSMTGLAAPTEVYGASNAVTVSTQKQLDKALKDKKVKKITVKTKSKKSLSIKKGSYTAKTLVIQGAKLTIKNAGKFKAIKIADAASYKEAAKNNSITVTDSKLTLTVDQSATVAGLTFAKANAKNTVKVNGTVKKIDVTKKTDLTLSGSTTKAVVVNAKAADSKVTSSVKVTVNASKDVAVKLNKGAEASKVNVTSKNATVDVKNNTTKDVAVKKADGTTEKVKKGASLEIGNTASSDTDKKDEDKKEDEDKKDENEKKDENAGGGSIGGGSYGDGGNGGNNSQTNNAAVTGVTLNKTTATLAVGDKLTLVATVAPSNAANKEVIWESSDTTKVTVDEGVITAVAEGTATITVKTLDGNKTATCTVTVQTPAQKLTADIAAGGTVTLTQDINKSVTATYEGTDPLTINFGKHILSSDFTLTAENATSIILNDDGEDTAGAIVKGNFTINAPKASVTNKVKVEGITTIQAVANNSFHALDSVSNIVMAGAGRLHVAQNLAVAPAIKIDTEVPIILAGTIKDVTVANKSAQINVEASTTVEKVKVDESVSEDNGNIKLSGLGQIKSVVADKPMTVEVPTTELTVNANVTVNAQVQNMAVETSDAEIKLDAQAEVSTATLASAVTSLTISGSGTLSEVDTSATRQNVSVTVNESAKIETVVGEAQKVTVNDNSSAEAPTVVMLKKIEVNASSAKSKYFVGDTLDVTGITLTAQYSNDTSKTIDVTASMVSGFNSSAADESQELTVTYGGKTATYAVTIKTPEVSDISVSRVPNKVVYTRLESLDLDGLTLQKTTEDGKKTPVEYSNSDSDKFEVDFAGKTADSMVLDQSGTITVTVTYDGDTDHKATFTVNVNPIVYTVTFNVNGGTPSIIKAQKVTENTKATKPATPTKAGGYAFDGWTLNGEKYSFDDAVTNDIELVASWKDVQAPVIEAYTGSLAVLHSAIKTWEAPTLTATDNSDSAISAVPHYFAYDTDVELEIEAARAAMAENNGIYVVYTATDAAGNTSEVGYSFFTHFDASSLTSSDVLVNGETVGNGLFYGVSNDEQALAEFYYNTVHIELCTEYERANNVLMDDTKNPPKYVVVTLKGALPVGKTKVSMTNRALQYYTTQTGVEHKPEADSSYYGGYSLTQSLDVTENSRDLEVIVLENPNQKNEGIDIRVTGQDGACYRYTIANYAKILDQLSPVQRLNKKLSRAASGDTVTLTEDITVQNGECIKIPKGVTLEVPEDKTLNLSEKGPYISVSGTLQTTAGNLKVLELVGGMGNANWPVNLQAGGKWIRGTVTYYNNIADGEYVNCLFERVKPNMPADAEAFDKWIVRGNLEIVDSTNNYKLNYENYIFDNAAPNASLKYDDKTYHSAEDMMDSVEKWQYRLNSAQSGTIITLNENLTLESGQPYLFIRPQITLEVAEGCKITIQTNAGIAVQGTLKATKDQLVFLDQGSKVCLNSESTWERGDITAKQSQLDQNCSAFWIASDKDNWYVNGTLSITTADSTYQYPDDFYFSGDPDKGYSLLLNNSEVQNLACQTP